MADYYISVNKYDLAEAELKKCLKYNKSTVKAEELMKKQADRKVKLEKEIQAQKIQQALFGDGQQFDAAAERERIRQEMQKQFEESAAQFVRNKESEMQAEF